MCNFSDTSLFQTLNPLTLFTVISSNQLDSIVPHVMSSSNNKLRWRLLSLSWTWETGFLSNSIVRKPVSFTICLGNRLFSDQIRTQGGRWVKVAQTSLIGFKQNRTNFLLAALKGGKQTTLLLITMAANLLVLLLECKN